MSGRSSPGRGRVPGHLQITYPVWLRALIATAYLLSVAKILPRPAQRWAAKILAGWAMRYRVAVVMRARALGEATVINQSARLKRPAPRPPAKPRNRRQRRAAKAKARREGGAQ